VLRGVRSDVQIVDDPLIRLLLLLEFEDKLHTIRLDFSLPFSVSLGTMLSNEVLLYVLQHDHSVRAVRSNAFDVLLR